MESSNIAAYRAQAEKCSRQSELTTNVESKLHSLAMTEGWQLLVDSFGKKDANGHVKQ